MKVLHVVRQFYPMIGGLESYVYNLAEKQIQTGHKVAVLTLNRSFVTNEKLDKFERLDNGIEIYRIPFFLSKKYAVAFRAVRYFKGFDIIHVHGVDFFMDYVSLTKQIHRKRTILTTHGGFFHTRWAYYLKKIFFHVITRFTVKSYNVVIGCSDNDVEVFKNIAPGIIKIDNGVNVDPLLNAPKKIINNSLLYVGRIDIHKRIDNLIRLVYVLKERGFNPELKIVGPDWKNLLPDLTRLADDLKVSERVTFTGPVSDKDLINHFSEAFLFISSSEYEGFGISAIEALASGTPCILNDIPSFRTILNNQPFGLLCDFDKIDNTASSIMEYSKRIKDNYLEISNKARELAKSYNWESVAASITSVYEQK